jgi:2-dehydropantoate 2-reductase
MGRLTKIATPALDSVLAMVTQRARVAGLYDGVSAPLDPRALAVA